MPLAVRRELGTVGEPIGQVVHELIGDAAT